MNTAPAITTRLGRLHIGDSLELLRGTRFRHRRGKVNLILTSPPFPLNRKKRYGNLNGDSYLAWITDAAEVLAPLLTDSGSIVIEMGNAWESQSPTMSTLPIQALLRFKEAGQFYLCQEFIMNNPARLPGPVEWVNKRRCRVKDSFSRFWWLSRTQYPEANNRRILKDYSPQMMRLLNSGTYNSGKRPSEHKIGTSSFLEDQGGSIPSNVITASNTSSNDKYLQFCRKNDLTPHPARMPAVAAEFFIKFLTKENDLVFDPFAGSCTTCAVAEMLDRRWWGIEIQEDYTTSAKGRFQ